MLRCTTKCSKLILHATAKALRQFFPTTFAVTLSAVALLNVLKVEFNFEFILYTVHYHFCFLNSRKLEQNSLESAPIIMFRRKITSPERFIFFFLSSHHITGTCFHKYRTATFAKPPNDASCLPLFSFRTNGTPKKSQSQLRYYHGILFNSSQ